MSVIQRYHWLVSDEPEFKKLHREFLDKYLEQAGAKEMLMNQMYSGSWLNYQVDVIFEDWSGNNKWDDFFSNTEEGQDFGQRINSVAKIIDRELFLSVDY